jgi:F0F1-type ATP synthase assembly protein I
VFHAVALLAEVKFLAMEQPALFLSAVCGGGEAVVESLVYYAD